MPSFMFDNMPKILNGKADNITAKEVFLNFGICKDLCKIIENTLLEQEKHPNADQLVELLSRTTKLQQDFHKLIINEIMKQPSATTLKIQEEFIKQEEEGFFIVDNNKDVYLNLLQQFQNIEKEAININISDVFIQAKNLRKQFFDFFETEEKFIATCQKLKVEQLNGIIKTYLNSNALDKQEGVDIFTNYKEVLQAYKKITNIFTLTSEDLLIQADDVTELARILHRKFESIGFSENLDKLFKFITHNTIDLNALLTQIKQDLHPDDNQKIIELIDDVLLNVVNAPSQRFMRYRTEMEAIQKTYEKTKDEVPVLKNKLIKSEQFDSGKIVLRESCEITKNKAMGINESMDEAKKKLKGMPSYQFQKMQQEYIAIIDMALSDIESVRENRRNSFDMFKTKTNDRFVVLKAILEQIKQYIIEGKIEADIGKANFNVSKQFNDIISEQDMGSLPRVTANPSDIASEVSIALSRLEKRCQSPDFYRDIDYTIKDCIAEKPSPRHGL